MNGFSTAEEEFAWAVGFWEGEGSCNAHKTHARNGNVYWSLVLSAGQNEREVLDYFQSIVGFGSVCKTSRGRLAPGKEHHRWTGSGGNAWDLAERMLPYLTDRRRVQLETAMEDVAAGQSATNYVRKDHLGRR